MLELPTKNLVQSQGMKQIYDQMEVQYQEAWPYREK